MHSSNNKRRTHKSQQNKTPLLQLLKTKDSNRYSNNETKGGAGLVCMGQKVSNRFSTHFTPLDGRIGHSNEVRLTVKTKSLSVLVWLQNSLRLR